MSGTVYFIHSPGRIKIGFTQDLEQRFPALRGTAGGPLALLGSIPADRRVEKAFHILLRPARIRTFSQPNHEEREHERYRQRHRLCAPASPQAALRPAAAPAGD